MEEVRNNVAVREDVPNPAFVAECTAIKPGESRPGESVEGRKLRIRRENKLFVLCALYSRVENYGVKSSIEFRSELLQINLAALNFMVQKDRVGRLGYDFGLPTLRSKCAHLYAEWGGATPVDFRLNVQRRCPEIFVEAENAFGLLPVTVLMRTNGLRYCKLILMAALSTIV